MRDLEAANEGFKEQVAGLEERVQAEMKARKSQISQINRLTSTIEDNKEKWKVEKEGYFE